MFHFNIWNRLKCWAFNYVSPVINTGIKLFVFYNNTKTSISMKLNHYYYSNETFHNTFNLLRYLVYKVDGYFLEYNVEPIEENWINTTMYYLDNNEIEISVQDTPQMPSLEIPGMQGNVGMVSIGDIFGKGLTKKKKKKMSVKESYEYLIQELSLIHI